MSTSPAQIPPLASARPSAATCARRTACRAPGSAHPRTPSPTGRQGARAAPEAVDGLQQLKGTRPPLLISVVRCAQWRQPNPARRTERARALHTSAAAHRRGPS
eukprot:scaffold6885_cov110-Isochrysis_galbana.AAC.3